MRSKQQSLRAYPGLTLAAMAFRPCCVRSQNYGARRDSGAAKRYLYLIAKRKSDVKCSPICRHPWECKFLQSAVLTHPKNPKPRSKKSLLTCVIIVTILSDDD